MIALVISLNSISLMLCLFGIERQLKRIANAMEDK